MGPEPIMGAMALLGLAILAAAGVLFWRKRRYRLYVVCALLPGLPLAIAGAQGQVGIARSIGIFFMFFAAGIIIFGLPLSGLAWWWLNRPGSRPGTLE